jgi:hypothetical protein
MIKTINKQNFLTTPFVAIKKWNLYNIQNDDLVLVEQSSSLYLTKYPGGSIEEIPVAMDYIDYNGVYPYLNRECDIALEQQDLDLIYYREGEKRSGTFWPNTEPQNIDGTFKRLVYSQVQNAFYNTYRNPVQIFGLENIDFQLGKTQRFLTDFFRQFNIPQDIFGDRIKEGTVQFYDNSLDDNVTIKDDSFGNLIALQNLFSKIQEVRYFGNQFESGSVETSCPSIIIAPPDAPIYLSGALDAPILAQISGAFFQYTQIPPYVIDLNWTDASVDEDGFNVYRSLNTSGNVWSLWSRIAITSQNVTNYQDVIAIAMLSASYYVSAFDSVGESTGSNIVILSPTSSFVPALENFIITENNLVVESNNNINFIADE